MANLRLCLVAAISLCASGCILLNDFSEFEVSDAGTGGSAGTAGSGGTGGSAGTAGSAGVGGNAGSGGSAGVGGTAGSGGSAGAAGTAGSAGVGGDTDAGVDDAGPDAPYDPCDGVVCPVVDCKVMGMCNPFDGTCVYLDADDDTACTSDGVPCTVDVCTGGVCTHEARDCSNLSGACADGLCNAVTGACEAVAKANNTICNDSDPCTIGDTCQGGSCQPGPQRDCSSSGSGACMVGQCNATTGACEAVPSPNNTPCADQYTHNNETFLNYCTVGDYCSAGLCVGGQLECATDCTAPQCNFPWCGYALDANNCDPDWENDGDCDCGCQFEDGIDCGTASVCLTVNGGYDWTSVYPDGNCPASWEGADDGCDCGCKWGAYPNGRIDPDCLP